TLQSLGTATRAEKPPATSGSDLIGCRSVAPMNVTTQTPAPAQPGLFSTMYRLTLVDLVLWALRIAMVLVVVAGTIGTLRKGTYSASQWFDFFMFGLTIGGIYALIAVGYTMVYGIL